jgi:hypothetical protein
MMIKMPRYDFACSVVENIDLNIFSGTKCAVSEINGSHLTRYPGCAAATGTPHPLDAKMGCADKIMPVHCLNGAADRLIVFIKCSLEIPVIVTERAGMKEDNPAVKVEISGNLIGIFDAGYGEYRGNGVKIAVKGWYMEKEKDECCKDDGDENYQDCGNRMRTAIV